jgi:hypothetical protein
LSCLKKTNKKQNKKFKKWRWKKPTRFSLQMKTDMSWKRQKLLALKPLYSSGPGYSSKVQHSPSMYKAQVLIPGAKNNLWLDRNLRGRLLLLLQSSWPSKEPTKKEKVCSDWK